MVHLGSTVLKPIALIVHNLHHAITTESAESKKTFEDGCQFHHRVLSKSTHDID